MDPNRTLAIIDEAIRLRAYSTAREHCALLRSWIFSGGFAPDWHRYLMGATFYAAWASNTTPADECATSMRALAADVLDTDTNTDPRR